MLRGADRVAVACDCLKQDVTERYGVPAERVISSFHGVLDNLIFELTPPPVRDIDVLFFGRIAAYKGVDVLLEAVRALGSRGAPPKVVIAGPGSFPLAPTPGVTVLNRYVDDRELATLVARARIVAMPYRDATGSQVPQTAFAYGTPVVASSVGCLREYIEDGVTGLLVPPGDSRQLADAIERILRDSRFWNSLSANARERARDTFANDTLTAALLAKALV
jgi:glycosyltransferase involved in cell wall biosynthesis